MFWQIGSFSSNLTKISCRKLDYLSIASFISRYCLRNKSWKPECVGSFNMDWRILVFHPEPEVRDKIY
jgi:hypothetical protein